jgi:integrase
MSGKRQFGTVRKLPSGRWQARYRVGERRVEAPRTFPTKGDASRWLAAAESDQARGLWLDPAAGKLTLETYANAWLRAKVRISPRTREIYESQLRLYILPAMIDGLPGLGHVALNALTPDLVRDWYGALLSAKGPSAAAKAYTRLRQILAQAVDDDRIAKNPCRIDGGGVERHPEQRFATLAELYQLAGAVPDRYRALVLTAGLAGLRQGELAALRRRDIDLPQATITVRRKRLRLASGQVIEDDPKSRAGRRRVAVPSQLVTELGRHLASYTATGSDSLIFTSPTGEAIERSNFRYRVWVPATETLGLGGLRFHDLRHTAGTLAARTGATTKELMARLGHASPQAAMVYQHAAEDRDRLIAERLAAMTEEVLAPVVALRPSGTPPEHAQRAPAQARSRSRRGA